MRILTIAENHRQLRQKVLHGTVLLLLPGREKARKMVLSDEDIKRDVVEELYWDSRVDASKVAVTVDNGHVTLSGSVPSYAARTRAMTDAWDVEDVVWVENRITVQPPATVGFLSDADIKLSVIRAITENPELDTADIRVSVKNGKITLEGSVDEYWKKWIAEGAACSARGICNIENALTVVPTMTVSDRAIAEDVERAIGRKRGVDIENIDVKVENGVVTLMGSVPSQAARGMVVNAAEFTRGVIDVIDDLTVEVVPGPAEGFC